MAWKDLSVGVISKATCLRLDSKDIFNEQLVCLITTKTKNNIQTYHYLLILRSLHLVSAGRGKIE